MHVDYCSLTCIIQHGLNITEKAVITLSIISSEDLSKSDEKEETKKDYEDGKGKKMDDSEVV